jgi:hypothetical protein
MSYSGQKCPILVTKFRDALRNAVNIPGPRRTGAATHNARLGAEQSEIRLNQPLFLVLPYDLHPQSQYAGTLA